MLKAPFRSIIPDRARPRPPRRIGGWAAAGACGVLLAGCEGFGRTPGPLVQALPSCGTRTFDIYFADGQAGLAPSARQAMDLTAASLRSCMIRSVKVTGLADASGGAAANLSLSQARAQVVAQALKAHGWPEPAFDLEAAGDQGAVGPGGVAEPLRRRTEVVVEAVPK